MESSFPKSPHGKLLLIQVLANVCPQPGPSLQDPTWGTFCHKFIFLSELSMVWNNIVNIYAYLINISILGANLGKTGDHISLVFPASWIPVNVSWINKWFWVFEQHSWLFGVLLLHVNWLLCYQVSVSRTEAIIKIESFIFVLEQKPISHPFGNTFKMQVH